MRLTTSTDIQLNKTDELNLSAMSISAETIEKVVTDLRKNTSVTKVDLQLCGFTDSEFQPICDALIKRRISLDKLNIKNNDLSEKSVPLIIDLMKIGIKELDISYNQDIENSDDSLLKLSQASAASGVRVVLEKYAQSRLEILLKSRKAVSQSEAIKSLNPHNGLFAETKSDYEKEKEPLPAVSQPPFIPAK